MMVSKQYIIRSMLFMLMISVTYSYSQPYQNNRSPLLEKPLIELPLGNIKPKGWLKEKLLSQKNGATGQLDKLYPTVMGERNGWLGGDGDQWERGPYWIDGLLPLAYILEDKELKEKAIKWVEWAIHSQQADGYFGPIKDFEPEPGLQRNNSKDWWPKMVVLKILQQYYSATADERVVVLFDKYFKYQLKTLNEQPLGHWTFWAEYRSADNLQAVYWLYNITGATYLLELADILHAQGFDFTSKFLQRNMLATQGSIHCVNLAQGLKEPIIYYQQGKDPKLVEAVKQGLKDIKLFNGQAQGMYGGDEALHGNIPTKGSELCSAVEFMYSLEKMIEVTADIEFAEQLEKIAFNALPTQIAEDFMSRQYFQQANQIQIKRQMYNFDINHGGTDLVFGLLTGYPCCTSNMHQGWPKFVQNLYYATPDHGVASMIYGASEVDIKVGRHPEHVFIEQVTEYPFEDEILFTIKHANKKGITFPYYLRIPTWTKDAKIWVNDEEIREVIKPGTLQPITRNWKSGDKIRLKFPMQYNFEVYNERSRSIERGPLVYALDIPSKEEWIEFPKEEQVLYGQKYKEVIPLASWNYGLVHFDRTEMSEIISYKKNDTYDRSKPWNRQNAPTEIKIKGYQLPFWKEYNGMAGPLPSGDMYGVKWKDLKEQELRLIPYGCTLLRISQFPILRK